MSKPLTVFAKIAELDLKQPHNLSKIYSKKKGNIPKHPHPYPETILPKSGHKNQKREEK